MALTPFSGTKPARNERTTFSPRADAFVTWFLDTFFDEIDAGITAFNFNSTNSTSTTSDTIATGSTTITVQASKSYVPGMTLKIASTADGTKWMLGEVTAYNSGTGSLTVFVQHIQSTGTYAEWTVSLAPTLQAVGTHKIVLHTGNGHGSTGTKIRRFTTALVNTGDAMTYADSGTNGGSITINADGIYRFSYGDRRASGGDSYVGLTLNAPDLTDGITSSTTIAYRLAPYAQSAAGDVALCSTTAKLSGGDVVRAQTDGNTDITDDSCMLIAEKIGNA
jgi:hypothetical protein